MAEQVHTEGHAKEPGHHPHHEQSFFQKYLWSTDHKVIALQYIFTGMLMALIGGFMAYDLLGGHARSDRRLWKLSDPVDGRCG
jgi:hypothetical protein